MKRYIILAFMLSFAFFLAACSDEATENTPGDASSEQQKEKLTFDKRERVAEDAPVISVNGKEIKGDHYNSVYKRAKIDLYQNGKDVSDLDVIKDQTIELLIEEELIRQDAENKGIEVTEKKAHTELAAIKKEVGEEQFKSLLEQYQMTEEEYIQQLINFLLTVEYMDSQFKIKVSDEEIKAYYEKLKEGNKEIEGLAEIEDRIETEIYSQKQREQLQVKVEELKKDAEIETLI